MFNICYIYVFSSLSLASISSPFSKTREFLTIFPLLCMGTPFNLCCVNQSSSLCSQVYQLNPDTKFIFSKNLRTEFVSQQTASNSLFCVLNDEMSIFLFVVSNFAAVHMLLWWELQKLLLIISSPCQINLAGIIFFWNIQVCYYSTRSVPVCCTVSNLLQIVFKHGLLIVTGFSTSLNWKFMQTLIVNSINVRPAKQHKPQLLIPAH